MQTCFIYTVYVSRTYSMCVCFFSLWLCGSVCSPFFFRCIHMWMHLFATHIQLAHWTLHYHKISPSVHCVCVCVCIYSMRVLFFLHMHKYGCVYDRVNRCVHVSVLCDSVCLCVCACVCVYVCVFPDGDKSEWLGGNRCQLVSAARKTEQSQSRYLPVQNAWQRETCI